jgi:cell division protein FtsI (penicillin-binding protein 3)
MLGRTDSRRRLIVVLVGFVVISTTLVGRLAFWQVVQRDRLAGLAEQQTMVRTEQPSHRGTIYDRTGTVVLATTVDRSRLVAAPAQLSADKRTAVAALLVSLLSLKGAAASALTQKMTGTTDYVILAHGIDADVAARIRAGIGSGDLAGISLEPEPVRVYPQDGGSPNTTLAAHLLGFVNAAGVGQYGVEQYYQSALAGQPTVLLAARNTSGTVLPGEGEVEDVVTPGVDLTLTLDAGLQLALEQELLAAGIADRAKSVSAVVMDPFTGAIYAEASYPSYDANDYQKIAAKNPSKFIDPVVSQIYEPGSVFKMLTAVAGLEKGVVTPTSPINDSGTLQLDNGTARVSDADHRAMGTIPFEDVIAYSRNVGAAKVAMRLGSSTKSAATILYDTWRKLGFGTKTGIDLAGEVAGLTNDPDTRTWRQIDLANGSFGQGVAVTPIQLAQGYSAFVNGGVLVQPHVVQSVGGQDRDVQAKGQVIPKKLTPTLIRLMNHVVTEVDFYRSRTLVPGYYVGGKTGTAQIWDSTLRGGKGDWKHNIFNYSFVGFIGKTAPRLIVAVQIKEGTPTINRQGHIEMPVMSFELFRRIATDAITTLDLGAPAKPVPNGVAKPQASAPATNPDPTPRPSPRASAAPTPPAPTDSPGAAGPSPRPTMPAVQPDPGGGAGEPTAGVTLPPVVDAAAVTQ